MAKILIADDESMMRDGAARTLARAGHRVTCAVDGQAALRQLAAEDVDVLVTDLRMPKMSGIELLHEAKALRPELQVVLMTAYATVATAVSALKQGAFDYLQKPFEAGDLTRVVGRAAEENRRLRQQPGEAATTERRPMIGDSEQMRELRRKIIAVARSRATVMVRGESGTGKEVVARAIHAASDRAAAPLVVVNCAALGAEVLESELFGHEPGAFPGADGQRQGRFEMADGGTLLLDEVGEIAPAVQSKLLRVLQEGCYERLGSGETQRVDVRIIATSNRDLTEAVKAGELREDLFYRLNVLPVDVPALRERMEDVPALARHVLRRIAKRDDAEPRQIEEAALRLLERHDWPGNVRELANLMERMTILHPYGVVDAADLPAKMAPHGRARGAEEGDGAAAAAALPLVGGMPARMLNDRPRLPRDGIDLKQHLTDIEVALIEQALDECSGVVAHAANRLKIRRTTLVEKMRKYGIQRPEEVS